MPNEKEVASLAEIYRKKTGRELSPAEALDLAIRVLHLYCLKHGIVDDDDDEFGEKAGKRLERHRRSVKVAACTFDRLSRELCASYSRLSLGNAPRTG